MMKPCLRVMLMFAATALGCLTTAQAQPASPNAMWGSPADAASATRSVVLAADARWANVSQGETVRFVAGASSFSWRFDGHGARSFDLRSVAPAGMLAQPVMVYVTAAPGHPSR